MAVICIASSERSFSKLKLVLRSGPHYLAISQGRLCDLALMRIKREYAAKAYFDEIINDFTSIKARKVLFYLPICVI